MPEVRDVGEWLEAMNELAPLSQREKYMAPFTVPGPPCGAAGMHGYMCLWADGPSPHPPIHDEGMGLLRAVFAGIDGPALATVEMGALRIWSGPPTAPRAQVTCPECRGTGRGTCPTCDQECDCEVCEGKKVILTDGDPQPAPIAGRWVDRRYVALLPTGLPGPVEVRLGEVTVSGPATKIVILAGPGWRAVIAERAPAERHERAPDLLGEVPHVGAA